MFFSNLSVTLKLDTEYSTASYIILLTCFDFRTEASSDQMSLSPREGAIVKEEDEEEPLVEGREDALVGTTQGKIEIDL